MLWIPALARTSLLGSQSCHEMPRILIRRTCGGLESEPMLTPEENPPVQIKTQQPESNSVKNEESIAQALEVEEFLSGA
ncbi:hypothetical protein ACOMHN_028983 [Nucella lapillus]